MAASLDPGKPLSKTSDRSRFSSEGRRRARIVRETTCPSSSTTSSNAVMARKEDAFRVQGIQVVKGSVEARDPYEEDEALERRARLLQDFAGTVFGTETPSDPPIRGPYGEAVIQLKPGAIPVKQKMFHIQGERKAAWVKLTDEIQKTGKVEPGISPWNSPSFPVPKKKPGEYRLVQDFRRINDCTIDDAHPLPRIEDILQTQGNFKIWSVLDLKDGYHQMPLRKEDRHITCMSTPRGTLQWKVLVMGLKNGNAMFQRMMEWVLRDIPNANPYVDDIIVGSVGNSKEELLRNHERDLRAVLETLKANKLVVDPKKANLFVKEVEFCGHVLRQGERSPAPGKLLSLQNWVLPDTISALRGFLGLTNYYASYVRNYADLAGPLNDKLKVGKVDGKKGSVKPVKWDELSIKAFHDLKTALGEALQVFQLEPEQPFVLRTDASHFAIGAVLEQERDGKWVPVAFHSRKLTKSQLNWTTREKETYAIVVALVKWAGWIGFQKVTVKTDHQSLRHWTTEHVDTPSGPRGRRARWHEVLSQFNLHMEYHEGASNTVADAMSRWAYPASGNREDVSIHGSAVADEEVRKMMIQEKEEVRRSQIQGTLSPSVEPPVPPLVEPASISVLTRSGREVRGSDSSASAEPLPQAADEPSPPARLHPSRATRSRRPRPEHPSVRSQSAPPSITCHATAPAVPTGNFPPSCSEVPLAESLPCSSDVGQDGDPLDQSEGVPIPAQSISEQGSEPPPLNARFQFKPSAGPKLKPGEGRNTHAPSKVKPVRSPVGTRTVSADHSSSESISEQGSEEEDTSDPSEPTRSNTTHSWIPELSEVPITLWEGLSEAFPVASDASIMEVEPPTAPSSVCHEPPVWNFSASAPVYYGTNVADPGKILRQGLVLPSGAKAYFQANPDRELCSVWFRINVPFCFDNMEMIWANETDLITPGMPPDGVLPPKVFISYEWSESYPYVLPPPEDGLSSHSSRDPIALSAAGPDSITPAPSFPQFRFQSQLPPEERRQAGSKDATPSGPVIPASSRPTSVMDQDWTSLYWESPFWQGIWLQVQEPDQQWPAGYTIRQGKMYFGEKLCVPEDLILEIVRNHHFLDGHISSAKLAKALPVKYAFPVIDPPMSLFNLCDRVKKGCIVCQASDHPNWQHRGIYVMTPIPEAPLMSVCLDIFSMPKVTWQSESYDTILLSVDRHSGWIIARPTQYLGLTGEKCGHLLMEFWCYFGIPSCITSDQGPQFSGQWFRTMCARLGVRQAFSQAYRPQANGRAEAAGKQLIMQLRRLHAEESINWVEALPRALRHIHDRMGPSGLTPYQILLGRDRPLAGIPYQPLRTCSDALEFFDRVEWMDRKVSNIVNAQHLQVQTRHNAKINPRPKFAEGDYVWHIKPTGVTGHKIQTQWVGPCTVVARRGNDSYDVSTWNNGYKEVHISQLKPFIEDVLIHDSVPLHYFQPADRPAPSVPTVGGILRHRRMEDGTLQFLVRWQDAASSEDTWLDFAYLVASQDRTWEDYCFTHGIESIPLSAVGSASSVAPSSE